MWKKTENERYSPYPVDVLIPNGNGWELGSIHSSRESFPYCSLNSWYSLKKDSTCFLSSLMLMFFSPLYLKVIIAHIKINDSVVTWAGISGKRG